MGYMQIEILIGLAAIWKKSLMQNFTCFIYIVQCKCHYVLKEENGEDYQDDMPSQLNSMYFKPSYPEASMLPPGQRMDTSDDMFGEVAYPETIEMFDSPGDRLEASGCNINDMQVKHYCLTY